MMNNLQRMELLPPARPYQFSLENPMQYPSTTTGVSISQVDYELTESLNNMSIEPVTHSPNAVATEQFSQIPCHDPLSNRSWPPAVPNLRIPSVHNSSGDNESNCESLTQLKTQVS